MGTMDESLYCKVFVDTPRDANSILASIASFVGGATQGLTVVSETLEVDVRRNEDFDPQKQGCENAFLFYRYYLDVVPTQYLAESRRSQYIAVVASILSMLKDSGCRVVAACDFEDELSVIPGEPEG